MFVERHPEENTAEIDVTIRQVNSPLKDLIDLIPLALLPPNVAPQPWLQRLVELLKLTLILSSLVFYSVKVLHQVGNVVVIVIWGSIRWSLLVLLNSLVGFGELAEGRERIGSELVEDTGNELRELLHLTGTVNGERVGGNGRVNCENDPEKPSSA